MILLKDLGSLDTFPGRGNLDEDTVFGYPNGFIEL